MSSAKEFLARWSQRKHAATQKRAEQKTATPQPQGYPTGEAANAPPLAGEANEGAVNLPLPGGDASAAAAFDLSQLPALESITAATDIRPFLAPGVPVEVARAALRLVWASDPAIRDHIGLSENSWNFNAPGSILGFGPIEMTDAVKQAAERIVQAPADSQKPAQQPPITESCDATLAAPRRDSCEAAPDAPRQTTDKSHKCEDRSQRETGDIAAQPEKKIANAND